MTPEEQARARVNRDYYCLIAAVAILTAFFVIVAKPSNDNCDDHGGLQYIKVVDDFGRVAVVCNDSYVVKLSVAPGDKK